LAWQAVTLIESLLVLLDNSSHSKNLKHMPESASAAAHYGNNNTGETVDARQGGKDGNGNRKEDKID